MAKLLSILFPKVRAEVLRLLFADASREVHLRDLTRQSGLAKQYERDADRDAARNPFDD